MALIGWAEGRVSSGVAAALGSAVPLFLALMDQRGLALKAWCGLGMGFVGVLVLLAASLTGGVSHRTWNPKSLLAVGYLMSFGSILAYSAYIYLSKVWPSAKAGTYAYWNPVVGVLLGCWLRGEPLHARSRGLSAYFSEWRWCKCPGRA